MANAVNFPRHILLNLKKINLPTDESWGQKGNVLAEILRLKRCNINR